MSLFYPDLMLNSIYEINIEKFLKNNIKAVVFDIDNTLACNNEEEPSQEVINFISELKEAGIFSVIASNNNEIRVKKFCKNIDCLYIHKANKPLGNKILRLLNKHNVKKKNTALVGDQIFTDVLCGNLMGMFTVLVKPFDMNENNFIKFKRKIENLFIKW